MNEKITEADIRAMFSRGNGEGAGTARLCVPVGKLIAVVQKIDATYETLGYHPLGVVRGEVRSRFPESFFEDKEVKE